MKRNYIVILLSFVFLITPLAAHAVIPPDFIFNAGNQILQIFSIVVLFFSTIFGVAWQFIKIHLLKIKYKRIVLVLSGAAILAISFGVAHAYEQHRQKMEYKKWLEESGRYRWRDDKAEGDFSKNPNISVSSSIKNSFFDVHKNDALIISNRQFQDIYINSLSEYLVLDAREDIEYENGHFPTSTHIRFADLKAGRWQELPADKKVIVICWSGIRGKETAEFLRSKGIVAVYLEKGANGWVEYGGAWEGNIKFAQKYTERRFELVFTTQQIKKKMQECVVLVDSREPIKFAAKHIPESFNISMFSTATADLPQTFSQIPQGSKVITICDDYVNCFDAKVTGVELEKRGYTFLGRYNKPWEF